MSSSVIANFVTPKTASAGIVTFSNISIVNFSSDLKFMATLKRIDDKLDFVGDGGKKKTDPVVFSPKFQVRAIPLGEINIVFDTKSSPPVKIPDNSKKEYSVPLNEMISRPIGAFLEMDGVRVTTAKYGELANVPFTVESVDVAMYKKIDGCVDQWKKDGGILCQWKVTTKESDDLKFYCGEKQSPTTLTKDLRAVNGYLSVEGLFHYHSSYLNLPAKKRVFKFTVTLPNSSTVENATHPVLVETPAWTIQFSKDFPTMVVENNPFNVSLKIVDINNNTVTSGLDSTAIVALRISPEFRSQVVMESPEMMMSNMQDYIIQKRSSAGKVTFSNITISNSHHGLKFMAALIRIGDKDKWFKHPSAYREFQKFVGDGGEKIIDDFVFSPEFEVQGKYWKQISIVFDVKHSPPAKIPEDSKKIYSVPLNQIISPIGAFLELNGIRITAEKHGKLASVSFTVESVDVDVYQEILGAFDQWKIAGGKLCQWKNTTQSNESKFYCGEKQRPTTLTKDLRAVNGYLSVEGLFHYHSSYLDRPEKKRVFKFTVTLPDSSTVENATHPVFVETPAWTIQFSKDLPTILVEKKPFNVSLKILDLSKKIVTTGPDSTAWIDLRMHSKYGQQVRMKSPETKTTSSASDDDLIQKRASAGIVTFSNVTVLKAQPGLKLSATLIKAENEWSKHPNAYKAFQEYVGDYRTAITEFSVSSPQVDVKEKSWDEVTLVFDLKLSPPAIIPEDSKKVYSVPLNQITIKPIYASLQLHGARITVQKHDDLARAPFTVESVDVDVYRKVKGSVDQWKENGGMLCQGKHIRGSDLRFYCGDKNNPTTLKKNLIVTNGHLSLEGLFHYHRSSHNHPAKKRVFKITVTLPTSTTVEKATNPVLVETPAWTITFSKDFPTTVVANSPFDVSLQILDINKNIVTTGLDSTAQVNLRVSWESSKQVWMSGPRVRQSSKYKDFVVMKRATAGIVTFSNIHINTIHTGLKFNATLVRIGHWWYRHQNAYGIFQDFVGDGGKQVTDPIVFSRQFSVTGQSASMLSVSSTGFTEIGANIPLSLKVVVEIKDDNGKRIFFGKDSALTVTAKTFPDSACLSRDAQINMSKGFGSFFGSICEPIEAVQLYFEATISNGSVIRSKRTRKFRVTGDIYLAHYSNFESIWMKPSMGTMEQMFIERALKAISNNKYPGVLKNRTLIVKDFNNKDDVFHTTREFEKMIKYSEKNPNKQISGIIGLGSNTLTDKLALLLKYYKMPTIGITEDWIIFGNKKEYPYFSRLCWDEAAIKLNLMLAAQSRGWNRMILISDEKRYMQQSNFEHAREYGIQIVGEVIVRTSFTDKELDSKMKHIKRLSTMIIILTVEFPNNARILRAAIRNEMACMHGYQWVTIEDYSWQFPWTNQHEACKKEPICTVAFTGLHAFSSTYQLSEDFEFDIDFSSVESPEYGDIQTVQLYALAYDAVLVYAKAMTAIIKENLTMTGPRLSREIRKVDIKGMTGRLHFSNTGNRPGYAGFLVTVNPHPPRFGIHVSQVALYNRYFIGVNYTYQKEFRMRALPPLDTHPWNLIVAPIAFPNTTFVNTRYYHTSTGMIVDERGGVLRPIPPDTNLPVNTEKSEITVAPFYCKEGCGGKQLDEKDITLYELGNCTSMNTCKCNDGYFGKNCSLMRCECFHGHCEVVDVCICDQGWTGDKCDSAICDTCEHGECTEPDVCLCHNMWTGSGCKHSVTVIILLSIIVLILPGICIFIIYRVIERRRAVNNLDWVVKWDDVIENQRTSLVSSINTESELDLPVLNIVTWKHCRCYVKKFDIPSLDSGKISLRKEMMYLKQVKHNNIIGFIGACLDHPNVSLLFELCSKGSLDDIILDDSVPLDWDFRFSLMKDICRGMDFLHNSPIESHGRLKSSSCLVDNRWTCKITGFGCPSFRNNPADDPEVYASKLLWTAPELLRHIKTLFDIRKGTKAGDVYSFSIIMSELITRDQPYAYERSEMEVSEIINLLKYKNSPINVESMKKLSTLGAVYLIDRFRPHIKPTHLLEDSNAVDNLIELLINTWDENPLERPTFKSLLSDLDRIYPIEGELIDNLLNMRKIEWRSWGWFSIVFLDGFSPPARIPADSDKVYSVPLNERISKPILAYLYKDNVRVTSKEHGDIASAPFTIESMDVNVYRNGKAGVDRWKQDEGTLCQVAYNVRYPYRWNSKKAKKYCGLWFNPTKLFKDLRLCDGLLVAEGLYHKHEDGNMIPANKRVFIFKVILPHSRTVENVTNPVLVEAPAWYLHFENDFPTEVLANQPFSFSLKIVDAENKSIVTTGLDSTAFVTVRVSWEYVTLFYKGGKDMFLRSTEARMAGPEVKEDPTYHDMVLEKRASAGRVTFTDVRILDIHSTVRLNATLTQARCNWIRTPKMNRDYKSLYIVNASTPDLYYKYKLIRPIDPSVILSKRLNVTAQSATSLELITPLEKIPTKIGANCPLELELEVRDQLGNRIFSGPDSSLHVELKTTRPDACLSSDTYVTMTEGRIVFAGSICEPINTVQIYFKVTTAAKTVLKSRKTNRITITNDIFIGHYDNFYVDQTGAAVGPTENAFVKYAVTDISQGFYPGLLKNRNLIVKSFNTKGDTRRAHNLFTEMVNHGKKNPNEMIRGIIGMGGNAFTRELRSLLYESKTVTVATKEDSVDFESTEYPYFSRLCWTTEQILQNLFIAFLARQWKRIIVVRDYREALPENFKGVARKFSITVEKEILLFDLPGKDDCAECFYRKEMKAVQMSRIRIVLYLVAKPMIYFLIKNAARYKVSCMDGYQWVTYGKYVNEFPWENEHHVCKKEPFCTVAFKGMHGFLPGYNVSSLVTKQWLRLLIPHFAGDSSAQKETIMFPGQDAVLYGLAYDATMVLAKALNSLIKKTMTFTASQIKQEIEVIDITGLTGKIWFDKAKHRKEYTGFLITVNPIPDKVNTRKSQVAMYGRYLVHSSEYKEIPLEAYYPFDNTPWNFTLIPVVIAKAKYVNKVRIPSSTGMISSLSFQHDPIPPSTMAPVKSYLEENAVAPFYCFNGCGGNEITKFIYDHGNCSGVNKCECIEGFTGKTCESIYCTCTDGQCFKVDDCICDLDFCSTFICKQHCVHGTCTSPNVCTCEASWIGDDCNRYLLSAIAFPVGLTFLAIVCLIFMIRYLARKTAKTLARFHLDCIFPWSEVAAVKQGLNFVYVARDLDVDFTAHVVKWRDKKCFVKKFNVASVDPTNNDVLNDLVLMSTLKHKNIVTFYGCCLTEPNVCVLLEVCPKGSLDDLLANDAVKLDFDFRFSILKDICRGMMCLHESEIESHGRLKSSNCLIDNRWTCKISDFGCPSLRYNTSKKDSSIMIPKYEKKESIFSAPEHQEKHSINTNTNENDPQESRKSQIPESRRRSLVPESPRMPPVLESPRSLVPESPRSLSPESRIRSLVPESPRSLSPESPRRLLQPSPRKSISQESSRRSISQESVRKSQVSEQHKKSLAQGESRKSLVPKEFRKSLVPEPEIKEKLSALYWTAPELLRKADDSLDKVRKGTKVGDVYSFSMIMVEVLTRDAPYAAESLVLSSEQIINLLKNKPAIENLKAKKALASAGFKNYNKPIFRPYFATFGSSADNKMEKPLSKLIRDAWHEEPTRRPSFKRLLGSLRNMYPVYSGMTNMLERYSCNLEDVLAERTKNLLAEKDITIKILGHLLPSPTLEQLKCGQLLEPEAFNSVTILMSDIIGFQSMIKKTTPIQLVSFLNDLYTMFDKIMESYDVFKVHTTGDAYTVIGGLRMPSRHHAEHVATLALDMLCSMVNFKIRFNPNKILEIRIGVHTGPVVGGVIGLTVPRYCIFGQAVTAAQNIHESSVAFKIHLSQTTAELLMKTKKYKVEPRDSTDKVKGGMSPTYWLMGKDNYENTIPDFDKLLDQKDESMII
ncbi:uncharacterized protein LOC121389705 [Gigantopelta aegis]|uniref:uncharacterized protein LOC121389705 n=1 Tax=Gigantopelta aegis TaxID=1735272 RepID=UPI001B88AA73|nr:uncharacterized protein LOC121389705 [Gigantopelta aegis]